MAEYRDRGIHNHNRATSRSRASNRNKIINRIVIVAPRRSRRRSW